MDFFRSVFADEPDPPPPPPPKSASDSETPPEHQSNSDSDSDSPQTQPHSNPNHSGGSGWSSFGGLIRTLTTKSESVIETYRRDLKEFSTGLRKEIEVAQGSLENVGQAFDEIGTSVIKGTAQIISQGKETILSLDHESDSSDIDRGSTAAGQSSSYDSRRYNRFDAQVRAIQGDVNTFCDEPEDLDDYDKWRSLEFVLQDSRDDIDSLLEENGTLDAIYKKVVPGSIDEETFWSRYYYRIYKLKQAEALRANLVKRAISAEEEDLSWDVDDDDDDESEEWKSKASKGEEKSKGDIEENQELKTGDHLMEVGKSDAIKPVEQKSIEDKKMGDEKPEEIVINAKEETSSAAAATVEGPKVVNSPSCATAGGNVLSSEKADEIKEDVKSAESSGSEGNGGNGGSCRDSDYSVVSSHQTAAEEEDLGWDEIEDLSGIDDSKKGERRVSQSGSSATKEELRMRLSVAEEEDEEDLSWDIEDDDEPVKS